MKQLLSLLLILSSASSYAMGNITPEQKAAFQKKYPLLTRIYIDERNRINADNESIKHDNADKSQQIIKLKLNVNTRLQLKINRTNDNITSMACALPGFTVAGLAVGCLGTSFDKEKIKRTLAEGVLLLAGAGVHIKRKNNPEFLSTTVSGLGMTASLDINIILSALAQHIYFHGISTSKGSIAHTTSATIGGCIANGIEKTESNWVINAPFSDRTLLRDNQIVHISLKTAGNLIAENKKPAGHEVLYELLKNTVAEIFYSTLAQNVPNCLLPEDCNPSTDNQKIAKYVITEGAGYIMGAIAPLVTNIAIGNNIASQTTATINACLRPLLPV